MKKYRVGQLFLIEVIVAISVLFVLITTLFATQTITSPPEGSELTSIGRDIVATLTDTGQIYTYLENANYSYYTLSELIFDENNSTKQVIISSIKASIPLIANFKAFAYRFNPSLGSWENIDIINYEANTPTGSEISVSETYIPGFNGVFDQFRFQLYLWFEVQS